MANLFTDFFPSPGDQITNNPSASILSSAYTSLTSDATGASVITTTAVLDAALPIGSIITVTDSDGIVHSGITTAPAAAGDRIISVQFPEQITSTGAGTLDATDGAGSTIIEGDSNVAGDTNVAGDSTFQGDVVTNGDSFSANSETVSLGTDGAGTTTVQNDFVVDGATTTTGTITANGGIVGNVEGALTGNADTATTLETSRDFSVSGDAVTASAVSFNGSGDVDLAISIIADGVNATHINADVAGEGIIQDANGALALSSANAGIGLEYVAGVFNVNAINVANTFTYTTVGADDAASLAEVAAAFVANTAVNDVGFVPLTSYQAGDLFVINQPGVEDNGIETYIYVGADVTADGTATIDPDNFIDISNSADGVTSITAANGLTQVGTSGSVSIGVGAGTNITVNTDDVALSDNVDIAGTFDVTGVATFDNTVTVAQLLTASNGLAVSNTSTFGAAITANGGIILPDSTNITLGARNGVGTGELVLEGLAIFETNGGAVSIAASTNTHEFDGSIAFGGSSDGINSHAFDGAAGSTFSIDADNGFITFGNDSQSRGTNIEFNVLGGGFDINGLTASTGRTTFLSIDPATGAIGTQVVAAPLAGAGLVLDTTLGYAVGAGDNISVTADAVALTTNVDIAGTLDVTGEATFDALAGTGERNVVVNADGILGVGAGSGGAGFALILSSISQVADGGDLVILEPITADSTLTIPSTPAAGTAIDISNLSATGTGSGAFRWSIQAAGATQIVIMGSTLQHAAGGFTLDDNTASFKLVYTNATYGWVVIGAN